MSSSQERPVADLSARDRLWWLPADGFGNGLDCDAWAPILEVDSRMTSPVLNALREAGVPAYACPTTPPAHRAANCEVPPTDRLWVGSHRYARAEDTLRRVIPTLRWICTDPEGTPAAHASTEPSTGRAP
ncbi:hypothetical protein [Segeticoccus rhizosphaerae]|uniref:hypothetical protein n=1 Tax=Segeticoccus rhizosphaerae TaxID=1104777 RepID=UPI0010BFD50B|nr:hypothetical protein [Ornithinicoccus soli]